MREHPNFMVFMVRSMGLQILGEEMFTLVANWLVSSVKNTKRYEHFVYCRTVIIFALERTIVIANPLKFPFGVRRRFAIGFLTVAVISALAIAIPNAVAYYRMGKRMGLFSDEMKCSATSTKMVGTNMGDAVKILVVIEVRVPLSPLCTL